MSQIPLPLAPNASLADVANLVQQYAALSPFPGVFNYRPGGFLRTRTALANVRKGLANAKIACIGDSTTRGQGSGTTTQQALNGWPVMAQQILAAKTGLVCRGQNLWSTGNATLSSFDARVTLGSWGGTGTLFTLGGPRIFASGAGTLLFAPTEAQFDTCDVYVANNTTGSCTVNFNAGATIITVNTTTALTMTKQSAVGSLGTNIVNVPWVSGTPTLVGLDCYNSAIKQVSFWNMGWLVSTTNNWASPDGTRGWDPRAALASATIAADLAIINLGINDYSGSPPAIDPLTYYANMASLIVAQQSQGGDVLLMTPFPSDSTVSPLDVQASYNAMCYNLALNYNCPLIDTTLLFGGARSWVTAFYNDTKHLNSAGYTDIGAVVSRVLQLAA